MGQTTFGLKKALVLDATGRPNRGKIVFLPGKFGVTYATQSNPAEKTLNVSVMVVDLDDQQWKHELENFTVTEQGFQTGMYSNQSELDDYNRDHQAQIDLVGQLEAEAAVEAVTLKEGETTVKKNEYVKAMEQLRDWPAPPVPVEFRVNRYSDIINYFTGQMTLTPEGVEWAKTLPFLDGTMGDYLDFN